MQCSKLARTRKPPPMSERASTKGREHTPGPWVLDGHNMSSILKCVVPKGDPKACHLTGDYDIIARCFSDNWRNDARLIAAAPDMFEALRAARQFIANGIELGFIRMPDADTPDPAHDTLPAIEAAIAKAEGLGPRADATPNPTPDGGAGR